MDFQLAVFSAGLSKGVLTDVRPKRPVPMAHWLPARPLLPELSPATGATAPFLNQP